MYMYSSIISSLVSSCSSLMKNTLLTIQNKKKEKKKEKRKTSYLLPLHASHFQYNCEDQFHIHEYLL